MLDKLEAIYQRFKEVEMRLGDPDVISDMKQFNRLNREYGDLKTVVEAYHIYKDLLSNIDEARGILKNEKDVEMRELAKQELDILSEKKGPMEDRIKVMLIPKDEEDDKKALVEIRAGTGGDEAGIFAGELYRMYQRYCAQRGWNTETLEAVEGTAGGFSRISFEVNEPGAYGILKFESGVHRVQRVPETESQGRVHTSAATVAVLPEAEDVDVHIDMKDVRRDTFRSSGAGGQHVNKTESAVRLTHIPSGIVVECQEGRSQHKNFDKALSVLRTRLYEQELSRRNAAQAAERKSLVSSGDRSAKIRTYNFPQSRVTDHRINLTKHNLNEVMNGEIQELIDQLQFAENAEKLKAGGLV